MKSIKLELLEKFPYSETTGYFNTSVIEYKNQLIYFSRKSIWDSKIGWFRSSISCLNKNTLIDMSDLKIFNNEQIEDPRAFIFNDKIHLGCAIFNYDTVVQRIYQLNDDLSFNSIVEHKIPHLQQWEKNWSYFVDKDGRLLCLYSLDPFCVKDVFTGKIVKQYSVNWNWKWGNIRGGTNPVLINGSYYTFFHSNTETNNTRIYYVGVAIFDSDTLELKYFSKSPICRGDKQLGTIKDYPHDNHVIFPMGVVFKENEFVISCGINDYKTGILTFNKDVISVS